MEEKLLYIKNEIEKLGLNVSERQAEQFCRYYEMLIERNQVVNLTAITEFGDVVRKHFADSLSIVYIKNMDNTENLIDIGTGAGFPGIPIKIMFPHVKVVLLDSLRKRVDFLNELTAKLGLANVEAVHGRAEDYARPGQMRECFDLCVSRAVANLSTLSEYCLPYVKVGGEFISYKSGNADDELIAAESALFLLGGKMDRKESFLLPDSDIRRTLIRIKKMSGCPKKYPRKSGTAAKSPLR